MMTKEHNIDFQGYWRDGNKPGIPNLSGIYVVYDARYNQVDDTVLLLKVLYIGESSNVQERIIKHDEYQTWTDYITEGHELCFSFGAVENDNDRRIIEAVLIYQFKPIFNIEFKNKFPYIGSFTIHTVNRNALLSKTILIKA